MLRQTHAHKLRSVSQPLTCCTADSFKVCASSLEELNHLFLCNLMAMLHNRLQQGRYMRGWWRLVTACPTTAVSCLGHFAYPVHNGLRLAGERDVCMIPSKTALHFCSLMVCGMTQGPSNAERPPH